MGEIAKGGQERETGRPMRKLLQNLSCLIVTCTTVMGVERLKNGQIPVG